MSAAARKAAEEPGNECLAESWQEIAGHWRIKQLQYSWLRAVASAHADFWQVTCDALDWALEAVGLDGDPRLRSRLLDLYRELEAYPEVPETLAELRHRGLQSAILSNGSPAMLAAACRAAGIDQLLDDVLSVEAVGVYKPHHSVYRLVTDRFGCAPGEVLFVSSNGWDASAASGAGFVSVWVNRAREPLERLPWIPAHRLFDLRGIPELAEKAG